MNLTCTHLGIVWLLWKIDGNTIGHGGECNNQFEPVVSTVCHRMLREVAIAEAGISLQPIMIQQLDVDGLTPIGSPVQSMYPLF